MTNTPEPTPETVAPPPRPKSIARRKGGIEWVTARLGLPAILGAVILQQNLAALSSFERVEFFMAIFGGAGVLTIAFETARKWLTFLKFAIPTVAAVSAAVTFLFFQSVSNEAANDRRCLAIQRDMLSSMPLRSDGPELFQALGCRPHGEGSVYAPQTSKRQKS